MPVKPPGPVIGKMAVETIKRAVATVFARAKARVLGPQSVNKRIAFGPLNHELSLPGLFEAASREEGSRPDISTLRQMLDIASSYIDATEARTTAQVVKEVTAFLKDAHQNGVRTDLKTVLGGKLQEVFADTTVSLRRIIDSEANNVKNVGILDGIVRINAALGVDDPFVYFVSVNDSSRCDECARIHCLEDGITPRVWRLSDVGHGYHVKGDDHPAMSGLHPNCRCTMASLSKGYGFVGGRVAFIGNDHDEYEKQN